MIWLLSHPLPLLYRLTLDLRMWHKGRLRKRDNLLMGDGGGRGWDEEEPNHTMAKRLVLYILFNTLWTSISVNLSTSDVDGLSYTMQWRPRSMLMRRLHRNNGTMTSPSSLVVTVMSMQFMECKKGAWSLLPLSNQQQTKGDRNSSTLPQVYYLDVE